MRNKTAPHLLVLSFVLAACGQNSQKEHHYEAVPGSITWDSAKIAAQSRVYLGRKGHLATITSQQENDFVIDELGGPIALDRYWLGAFQPSGSPEPDGNWQWVTGEQWSYTNWYPGEPNNHYGGDEGVHPNGWPEDALHFAYEVGQWNDFPRDVPLDGYIVEYE